MKQKIGHQKIALAVFAIAFASLVPSAFARQCSVAGAVGKYGFSDAGTVVGVGARAAVGLLTFNQSGQIQGQVTASLNGNVGQTSLSGTFTVNPDCSGTTTFGEFDQNGNLLLTVSVAIVWDDNMREARFLFTSVVLPNGTSLATAVRGDAKKLFAESEN